MPENDRVAEMHIDVARYEIARDDSARMLFDDDQIQHFSARIHGHCSGLHLPLERLVRAEQKLLPGLASRIECTRDLSATKGPVRERAAVFPRKRHALRHTLIDDMYADLREAIDICLASAEVAALYGVVKQPVDTVAIVLIILGRVDAALRCNRVSAARRILETKAAHLVAELAERCGRGCAGKARPNHDDRMLALVGRIDQLHIEARLVPHLLDCAGRNSRVQFHYFTKPSRILNGIEM